LDLPEEEEGLSVEVDAKEKYLYDLKISEVTTLPDPEAEIEEDKEE